MKKFGVDKYELISYGILVSIAFLYVALMFAGLILVLPFGLIGLLLMLAVGLLLAKVIKERLANKEDDYYAEKVEK